MNRLKLVLGLTLCLSSLTWSSLSATAQRVESEVSTTKKPLHFIQEPLSNQNQPDLTRRGTPGPGRREGAGSRGCPPVEKPLTALVPITKNSQNIEYVLGTTTAEYPTFWFYVPYKLTPESKVIFVLTDDQSNEIYTVTSLMAKGTTPGIISLHPTKFPLKVGQNYQWYFYVDCNPTDSSESNEKVVVNGWVQRLSLQETPSGTPLEQAVVYGRKGMWYDTLTIVGEQLRANPQDAGIKAKLTGLLQAIGLGTIPSESLQELKVEIENSQPITY